MSGECDECGEHPVDGPCACMRGMKYPEHTKLKAVHHQSQTISEFIDWLQGVKGMHIMERGQYDYEWHFARTKGGVTGLLAEYFKIDLDKLEAEKRQMLDELRARR